MNSFPKTAYWRHFVLNAEIVDDPNNPYFKNPCVPTVLGGEVEFALIENNFSKCLSIPAFKATYENMRNFVSGILQHIISGELDIEEAPRIVGYVNPNIQGRQKLAPKTAPVDCANMLLPITKNMQGKKEIISFQKLAQW